MKEKLISLRTLSQFVFIVIAFILSIIISMGFTIDPEQLYDVKFWLQVAVNMTVMLIIYNLVFGIDNRNRRQITDSNYFVTLATNKLRVNRIYDEGLFSELDRALEEEQAEKRREACNKLLQRVTSRLSYKDIENAEVTEEYIAGLAKQFLLSERKTKQLDKVIKRIINGKVRYERVTADDILIDRDSERDNAQSLKFSFKNFLVKQNAVKSLMFLVSTVLFAIVNYKFTNTNIWQIILNQLVMFSGSVISAIGVSRHYIKLRTLNFAERNRFLERRMGIKDKYEEKAAV